MKQFENIDFHTHILPGIDDGAKSIEDSLEMLSSLAEQGVTRVVLTPHYYSHREPMDRFLERRKKAFEELIKQYSGPITLHLGAEVYYSDYLFNNEDISSLCIDETNTLLLELPYNKTVDSNMLDQIWRLSAEYSADIVIAHIERYPTVFKSYKTLDKLLSMGCVLQVNLSSLEQFGKRRLLRLFKDGYIGAIGTDSHNMENRKPSYTPGLRALHKTLPEEDLCQIFNTMKSLIDK